MNHYQENAIEFRTGDDTVTVSFTNQKMKNRLARLYKEHKDDFIHYTINNDGSVYAKFPMKFFHAGFYEAKTPEMSEEQKKANADRLRAMQKAKKGE